MAHRTSVEPQPDSEDDGADPTSSDARLSELERRRTELWTTLLFVVAAVAVAIAVYVVGRDLFPDAVAFDSLAQWILVVLLGGLALAFVLYVIEKERNLRKLTRQLLNERVLSAALSNRLTEISRLSEVGKAVNTTLDIEDVFELILTSALDLLGGSEGSIMLLDDDGVTLRVVSHHGPAADKVKGTSKLGQGISGTVAARKEPMLIQGTNVAEELRGKSYPNRGIHSSMCVPLVSRDELLGVLNLNETERKRAFNENDLAALGFFAEHAAIAIANARAFEKERETISRLEELDRMKSDFVATVSHELKTPITAIIGAAKTVSRKGAEMGPEQSHSFIEMIDRQGSRLLRLVEDVLITAEIESGGQRAFRRELLDLADAARDVINELRQTSVGRDREIRLHTEPEHPFAWGDLTAIQQIIINLGENALKYSEPEAPVVITIRETPEEAMIEVSDRGRGIGQAQLESIFERFRQIEAASTRSVGGFGLGLYIVKRLVDAHNGSVEVESEEGMGSTFRVHLPKRESDRGKLLGPAGSDVRPAG